MKETFIFTIEFEDGSIEALSAHATVGATMKAYAEYQNTRGWMIVSAPWGEIWYNVGKTSKWTKHY